MVFKYKIFKVIFSTVFACACLIILVACGSNIKYEYEAGDIFPDAETISGIAGAEYVTDLSTITFNVPGNYKIKVKNGIKTENVNVIVKDTKAPEVSVKNLTISSGSKIPKAQDFATGIIDGTAVTASYKSAPSIKSLGDYPLTVIFEDLAGNKSEYDVVLCVITDTEPPTINASDITVYVGDSVAYKKNVVVDDNCGSNNVTLTVNSKNVNTSLAGKYTVEYTAVDISGNVTVVKSTVTVINLTVTEDMLNDKIDEVIATKSMKAMTKQEQIKAIYDYVKYSMTYQTTSVKDDWVREAYSALFVTHTGDCFSFYSASKAFFERLGIDNMEVRRSVSVNGETHYWSLVNIGTKASPKWYHYDSCPMTAEYRITSYLLTDAQIMAYNKWRGINYYSFNAGEYPQREKTVIVKTPNLEKYY